MIEMVSVQSNIKCPDCGNKDAIYDAYCNTGEVYITCNRCGFNHSNTIQRDDNGKFIEDSNGKYQWKEEKTHGAGIFEVHRDGAMGYGVGTLLQDKEERKKQIAELKDYEQEAGVTVVIKEYTDHITEVVT